MMFTIITVPWRVDRKHKDYFYGKVKKRPEIANNETD